MGIRDNAKLSRALPAAFTGLVIGAVLLGFVGSWGLALSASAAGSVIAVAVYIAS